MIKRVFIDNYRCFVNFEVQLDEFTLILGHNGSGKSSLLDIIFAVRRLLSGEAKINDPDVFPAESLTRWQQSKIQVVEIDIEFKKEVFRYRLEVEHETKNHLARVKLESLSVDGSPLFEFKMGEVQLYRDNHSLGPKFSAAWSESALARIPSRPGNARLTNFLEGIQKIIICGLYPKSFLPESKTEDAMLDRDGKNFASWYRHITQERQDLISEYFKILQEVILGFKSIRLEKVGIDTRAFLLNFETNKQRYSLNLDEISDGQRALLVLYALLQITKEQGYILLFDEPDNYISLNEIQPWLMAISDSCGVKVPQAVICSHHPEIMDYIGANSAIHFRAETNGAIKANLFETEQFDGGLKFSEIIARGWEK